MLVVLKPSPVSRSSGSVQMTVVPSTVLEPLWELTSPGNVTATLKRSNILADMDEESLPVLEFGNRNEYWPFSWLSVQVEPERAIWLNGALPEIVQPT